MTAMLRAVLGFRLRHPRAEQDPVIERIHGWTLIGK